ncbi:luciferase-like monooxygenase family protein [Mycobacterium xenopi 4042]|uniref:Luciferase-like monooxygenase family protein n=1 Tax=Mycobacterium xenopi 4042 TaxID=1299334 RepID=X7ZTW0_MYCXE|nr:luciferase-like monooxygenase family protein [Mycobacterium xenopi 4042]
MRRRPGARRYCIARDQRQVAEAARWAENLGFDLVASGEHLFFHGRTPNAFVVLAAAAGATERVRLLSALTILPVYPAVLAAKLVATLDQVSNGRFDFGVGVGGEYPPEFAAAGVPVGERGARTDEALALILRLLRGGPVDFAGRWTRVEGLSLNPPALQTPAPPVWVGAAALPLFGAPGGSPTSGCPTCTHRSDWRTACSRCAATRCKLAEAPLRSAAPSFVGGP